MSKPQLERLYRAMGALSTSVLLYAADATCFFRPLITAAQADFHNQLCLKQGQNSFSGKDASSTLQKLVQTLSWYMQFKTTKHVS